MVLRPHFSPFTYLMGVFKDLLGTVKSTFKIGKANFDAAGLSATRTITIQNSSHTLVGRDTIDTLTNKRNQKRTDSQSSTATLTPEIASYDIFIRSALTSALTINNHSTSTPADGEMMQFKLKDNGSAQAIAYGNKYRNMTATKATTTVANKWLIQIWQWSAADSMWDLMFQHQEA